MSGAQRENAVRVMLNRSAVVVKPKQPLDRLPSADPTSGGFTLDEVERELTIYLIQECDTKDDVHEGLEELCEDIFVLGGGKKLGHVGGISGIRHVVEQWKLPPTAVTAKTAVSQGAVWSDDVLADLALVAR